MKLRNLVKICAAAKDLLALLCSCKSILAFLFTTFFMHISNIAALWHAFWSCTHSCFTCLLSFYIVLSPAAPWAAMCGPLGRNVPSKKTAEKLKETLENSYSLHSNTYIATKKPLTTIEGHDIFESGTADRDFQKSLLFVKKTCYENIRLFGALFCNFFITCS